MNSVGIRERLIRFLSVLIGILCFWGGVFLFTRPEIHEWKYILFALWAITLGVFFVRFGITGRPRFKNL